MGMLQGLNKGGEFVLWILEDSNELLLEFSPNWVLLKLPLVVWIRFELSDKPDSEYELLGWLL